MNHSSPCVPRTRAAQATGPRAGAVLAAIFLGLSLLPRASCALGQIPYVTQVPSRDSFRIVAASRLPAAAIYAAPADHIGVVRAARDLQADIARVTGRTPAMVTDASHLPANTILVGTIGKSPVIDRLIRKKKIDVTSVAGKWEASVIQVVPHPLPGVEKALVIAGSDKRGTIFGIYDLSEQIGVSPWYWWADVPVRHRDALFVKPGRYVQGEPAVKYRGIFLNDEAPAMAGWAHEKFGGFNHVLYSHVFELLLRLKANYLWPAMWGRSLWEDDPATPKLANDYGIVLGTSHHEPMLRAQADWQKHGSGPWDYAANGEALRNFWTEGVRRSKDYEDVITLGMRGDGDKPMMADADAASKRLETIVADQRRIIARETGRDPAAVPQLWALYKEVQDYYAKGMRVPDDVTLLWTDDNWGNLRRLPTPEERKRRGGAGIYYHFDYVGAPRSYKWLNTVPLPKIWEQMNLAHQYGANRIWIVNVGDLKPMEFPTEFFLDFAREPQHWPREKLAEYTRQWAEREFGPRYAPEIADIVRKYTKYNGRRKPELLAPDTFSLVNYNEAENVAADWKRIADEADQIYRKLPPEDRDAFFELVLYPTKACAVVNALYVAAGRNRLYAAQGRASTNDLAAEARRLFQEDADLAAAYNTKTAGGKWDHMMDQTHIGYTSWNDPPINVMPAVQELPVPATASLGVSVEGSAQAWPAAQAAAGEDAPLPSLPPFDAFGRQRRYIDLFRRGEAPAASFTVTPSAPWIEVSAFRGTVTADQRLWVRIDWSKAPRGTAQGTVTIRPGAAAGTAAPIVVNVEAFHPTVPTTADRNGFIETDGCVSIEAAHYTARQDAGAVGWRAIDDYGRTLSSMTILPVTAPSVLPPRGAPCLEYGMYLFHAGKVQVESILAPSLDFVPGRALRFAVSFDDQRPQIVEVPRQSATRAWAAAVRDGVFQLPSVHMLSAPGYHTLKFWMVDPGVVLQKLVVNLGGVRPSYLGPPESVRFHVPSRRQPGAAKNG